jgi:hypothetical protein
MLSNEKNELIFKTVTATDNKKVSIWNCLWIATENGVSKAAITKFILCLRVFSLFNFFISLKTENRPGRRDSSFKPRRFRANRDVW